MQRNMFQLTLTISDVRYIRRPFDIVNSLTPY